VAEETAEQQTSKPASKLPIGNLILVLVVALAASAGGGFLSFFLISKTMLTAEAHGGTKEDRQKDEVADALEKGAVVPLDPFIVNLADTDTPRYLRIKVSLMVDDKTKIKELTDNQALQQKVRDVILQTLTEKTSQDLITDTGKNKLRQEIQAKISDYFRKPKLVDVMFTDFVIQL
jgi:flagellar FliL protein